MFENREPVLVLYQLKTISSQLVWVDFHPKRKAIEKNQQSWFFLSILEQDELCTSRKKADFDKNNL